MLHPLVSSLDVARYKDPDAVADAFTWHAGMSSWDRLARAWGHSDDWESDDMGACASIYPLDAVDRRLLALAQSLDSYRGRLNDLAHRRYLAREMGHPEPIARAVLYAPDDSDVWAYVRADDRGAWTLWTGSRAECEGWLAEWVAEWAAENVAENVAERCGVCGCVLDNDDEHADACDACAAVMLG